MASCAVIGTIGSNQWNAEVYGSLSLAAKIASLVKDRSRIIKLAFALRRLNGKLANSLDDMRAIIDGRVKPAELTPEEMDAIPERGQNAIQMMRSMHAFVEYIYVKSKHNRLTNNSLIAGPLNQLHQHAEQILEIAEWLELVLQPTAVEEIFNRASAEKEHGEIYDIRQVQ